MSTYNLTANEVTVLNIIQNALVNGRDAARVTFDVSGSRGRAEQHPNLKHVAGFMDFPFDGYEQIQGLDYKGEFNHIAKLDAGLVAMDRLLSETDLSRAEIGAAVKGLHQKYIGKRVSIGQVYFSRENMPMPGEW